MSTKNYDSCYPPPRGEGYTQFVGVVRSLGAFSGIEDCHRPALLFKLTWSFINLVCYFIKVEL